MLRLIHLPDDIRLDAPLWGIASGLTAGETLRVDASLLDHLGQRWESQASFRADSQGRVDLAAAAPIAGEWRGSDAYGLYWSMRLAAIDGRSGPAGSSVDVATSLLSPLTVELTIASSAQRRRAEVRREVVAAASVVQWRDELVANLFLPHHRRRRGGAVLVLGGSAGGFAWSNQVAAMLAASGLASVALAYFDWEGAHGLPSSITELPLEQFERALDRVGNDSPAGPGPLAVVGFSKGAEAALALAVRRDDIGKVVAVAPSAYVWEAARTQRNQAPRSSWTWRGEPLPFLRLDLDDTFYNDLDKTRLRAFHEAAIATQEHGSARIPVETATAEILLVSGTEDSTWPAAPMAEQIVSACSPATSDRAHHLACEGAGHLLLPPGLPAHRWDGDPASNAQADRTSWAAIRRFLLAS